VSKHVHFISDLHLSKDRPETTQRFLAYLDSVDATVSDLYILGDLFDVWVGDDDPTPPNEAVKEALNQLTTQDIHVHFLPGNRDFLIGEAFFKATNILCLEDESVIDLFGTKTLLMHGDLLCTEDVEYQKFRQLTHNPAWQQEILSKPLQERLALAQHYRQESHLNKNVKSAAIMDTNEAAVIEALKKHQVSRLIHGHTHRPYVHSHLINGQAAERFVLAEWDTQGSILDWSESGYQVITLS